MYNIKLGDFLKIANSKLQIKIIDSSNTIYSGILSKYRNYELYSHKVIGMSFEDEDCLTIRIQNDIPIHSPLPRNNFTDYINREMLYVKVKEMIMCDTCLEKMNEIFKEDF